MTAASAVADLRYPIGTFEPPAVYTPAIRQRFIDEIAATPARMRAAVEGLSDTQLDTPYRPGGWSVRQVVHHVPDSHLNAYVRHKLALTEEGPTIKPYMEDRWAELADSKVVPVAVSLTLLEALHTRWDAVWRAMRAEQWSRTFRHPEHGEVTIDWLAALYAWHGRHHVGHILALRKRSGWGG